jgi:anti-sigma factor ChrR (cupin superfamily)
MSEPLHLPGFLPGGWAGADFGPFREGVEIAKLHDGPPGVALLRYAPGASVPAHRHRGLETILVLRGSQSDERGTYCEGSLVLNPEGTSHRVWSEDGCVVLIQWTLPVEFLQPEPEAT